MALVSDTKKTSNPESITGIKFLFHVEVSDHEGYCSGAENEYDDDYQAVEILFDKKYNSQSELTEEINNIIAEVKKFCDNPKKSKKSNKYKNELKRLIPELHKDSLYCDLSDKSIEHGLGIHDYRITIFDYELV